MPVFVLNRHLTACILFLCIGICLAEIEEGTHEWQQKLTESINLNEQAGDPADFFKQAVLTCSKDWMAFVVTFVEEGFEGVMYTRGSYYTKKGPCYISAEKGLKGKDIALKLPIKDCGIEYDEKYGGYMATVVVQKDPELIFPGDVAFNLLCSNKEVKNSKLKGMRSIISLVSADPGASSSELDGALSSMSPGAVVTLTPPKLPPPSPLKEEL